MKIALLEDFPLLHSLLTLSPDLPSLLWEAPRNGQQYDLVLCDRAFLLPPLPPSPLILVPHTCKIQPQVEADRLILRGGMDSESAVTLSSIKEEEAWLCLTREIRWQGRLLGPFEKKIPFRHSFSLFKNLAVGFARCLADPLLGEES